MKFVITLSIFLAFISQITSALKFHTSMRGKATSIEDKKFYFIKNVNKGDYLVNCVTEICTSFWGETSWKLAKQGSDAGGDYYNIRKEVDGCEIKHTKDCHVIRGAATTSEMYEFYISNDSSVTGSNNSQKWCIKSRHNGKFFREDKFWRTIKTTNKCNAGNKQWYLIKD